MADEITIEEMMNRMPKAFLPEKAGDVDAVIQFHFTGEEEGDWIVRRASRRRVPARCASADVPSS